MPYRFWKWIYLGRQFAPLVDLLKFLNRNVDKFRSDPDTNSIRQDNIPKEKFSVRSSTNKEILSVLVI